jgi:hypothetical protein
VLSLFLTLPSFAQIGVLAPSSGRSLLLFMGMTLLVVFYIRGKVDDKVGARFLPQATRIHTYAALIEPFAAVLSLEVARSKNIEVLA